MLTVLTNKPKKTLPQEAERESRMWTEVNVYKVVVYLAKKKFQISVSRPRMLEMFAVITHCQL